MPSRQRPAERAPAGRSDSVGGGRRGRRCARRAAWRIALTAWLGLAAAWGGTAAAEDDEGGEGPLRPELVIGWTKTPPVIDGRMDPAEWVDAAHVDGLTQATPDPGGVASEHTEVWIMTDEDHLYLAARMWDSNPDAIVAFAMERDADTRFEDRFGFTIDPFLDRQNGYFFQVNVNGVRRDFLLEGNVGEGSWDGRWYAKTSVDAEGWTLEVALPYATINFDPEADVWGFNMARGLPRRDEIDRWSDPSRERFVINLGRAGNLVGMKGVRQGRGLQLIPSMTLRRVDDHEDPPVAIDDTRRHYTRFDPSFDAFYKITPSVTAALTVNTDFGETEVDERRVNLSRFELFFPEKRDFFLQDALIFDFADLSENGRPFFSRRIGLDQNGKPVGITAGGKLTGRVGRVKFGLLDVVIDDPDEIDQQNLFVARAAANFGESSLGLIATHGDPASQGENAVLGADFVFRDSDFLDDKTLRASVWAQGSYNDPDRGPGSDAAALTGLGYAFGAGLSYPNDRTSWELAGRVFDDDFDPALGFANRVGIREWSGAWRRRWRLEDSPIQYVDSRVSALVITEQGRQVESAELLWRAVEVRNFVGDAIRFEYRHRYEAIENGLSNLSVALGRYHFDEGVLRIELGQNRAFAGSLEAAYGSFFDGTRSRAAADLQWRVTKHVQTGLAYALDDFRLPNGDQTVHVVRARLSLLFTPDISWTTLVQFDNVTDQIGVNSRFRWIIEDGRELFLVVNQGFDARNAIRPTRTAPLVKLQWTLRF